MNSPHHQHHHHHHHHEHHHDVHQQRLLWFFSFCNQRSSGSSGSSSSSSSSSGGSPPQTQRDRSSRNTSGNNKSSTSRSSSNRGNNNNSKANNRNKFAIQYQQQLLKQQKQSSCVFGCDLIHHTNLFSQDDSIPHIVKSCTKFIEKNGIIFGIYRLSGMRVNINKLRQEFDKNPKISMIDSETISNDAHAVACVLKQYFRELPIPLLTFHMYERFINLFKQSNNNTQNQNQPSLTNPTPTTNIKTTSSPNKNSLIKPLTSPITNSIDDKTMKHYNSDQVMEYVDDNIANTNCGIDTSVNNDNKTTKNATTNIISSSSAATTTTTTLPMTIRSKSSSQHPPITNEMRMNDLDVKQEAPAINKKAQSQFASSVSDSQLVSLSSVVTTTTSDIKYQVKLEDLKQLLLQLPKAHYETLKFLMRHLACIAANGEKTGMDSKNVAIVWAPNLLKPRELELSAGLETLQIIGLQAVITEQLIKHHGFLFNDGEDYNDEKKVDGRGAPPAKTTAELNSAATTVSTTTSATIERIADKDKLISMGKEEQILDERMKIDEDPGKLATHIDNQSNQQAFIEAERRNQPTTTDQSSTSRAAEIGINLQKTTIAND